MSEHAKIKPSHVSRIAIVYVRQSSAAQVEHNRESTARQYALTQRAAALGWSADRVTVIDEDLGLSGATTHQRSGFARMTAEVALSHVGIILGLEVSRMARNNADWYRLLDLCSMTDTLIGDADGVYHPSLFNDRLLLGLKGTMSEAELHVLRARLDGAFDKAARAENACLQQIDRDVVQQRGELLLLPLPCSVPYTVQPGDTLARRCVRCVRGWPAFPLVPALAPPTPQPPRRPCSQAPSLLWPSLDFSGPYIIGYGSSPSRRGPARYCGAGQTRDLPVPVQGACTHARFYDHAGSAGARDGAPADVAFRGGDSVGTRDQFSIAAQWLACAFPYRRFTHSLAAVGARLGADVVRYSFIAVDLHHLLLAGLPAHDRGRDAHCWAPPAQTRTCPIRAYGSYLGCLTAKRCSGHG